MNFPTAIVPTALLLAASNVFMTFAWYGHLKNMSTKPWYIAAFVSWERRTKQPMLDLSLFGNPRFTAASTAVAISFFALSGFIFLVTQMFQFLKGYGPLSTGVRLLPVASCVAISSILGARLAVRLGTTRSAAALDLWMNKLEGAVVAIGNAPTALFRLLELLDGGAPRPAAILGIPVGFVGAAESKDELMTRSRGIPFLVVRGRLGGSAMVAAAINALARPGL